MGSIEKAVAKINRQQEASTPGATAMRFPRRERLVLSAQPNTGQVMPNRQVQSEASQFTLPYAELEAEGMVEPAGQRNQLSEEYRAIKRPILSAIDNANDSGLKHGNIVMVTSSVSGEGKTFSAINLAISIAMERDRTVLLVDGDVTNPTAGKRFGFHPTQPGLTDVLMDTYLNINDVIYQSDIPNLRFMPAGSAAKHVTECADAND